MSLEAITLLEDHPLVRGEVTFLDMMTAQFAVEDASTAIPQLLDWCAENGVIVESINEYVPPFDDVFVMIMQQSREEEGGRMIPFNEFLIRVSSFVRKEMAEILRQPDW